MRNITIEEQRELCAKFMGWQEICGMWCEVVRVGEDDFEPQPVMCVSDYRPDTDIEQAKDLKDRLKELGYTYCHWYFAHRYNAGHDFSIHAGNTEPEIRIISSADNCASEEVALTACRPTMHRWPCSIFSFSNAVARLQKSIEGKDKPANGNNKN